MKIQLKHKLINYLKYFYLLYFMLFIPLHSCTSDPIIVNTVKISKFDIESNKNIEANLGTKEHPISSEFIPTLNPVTLLLSVKYNKVYLHEYSTAVSETELTGKFYKNYLKGTKITSDNNVNIIQTFNPIHNEGAWYIWEQIFGLPTSLTSFSMTTNKNNNIKNISKILFPYKWPKNSTYDTRIFSTDIINIIMNKMPI